MGMDFTIFPIYSMQIQLNALNVADLAEHFGYYQVSHHFYNSPESSDSFPLQKIPTHFGLPVECCAQTWQQQQRVHNLCGSSKRATGGEQSERLQQCAHNHSVQSNGRVGRHFPLPAEAGQTIGQNGRTSDCANSGFILCILFKLL